MKPLVIYHADCTDGYAAAFAAWLKLGDEAEYLPMRYNQPTETIIWQDREVYILDFSFDRDTMEAMFGGQECAKRVVWLDHHLSAIQMWTNEMGEVDLDKHYVVLSDHKSGAWLSWEYFHPDTEVPMLIKHIDDRDRWQWKLDGSAELHAALSSYKPWSFGQWDEMLSYMQHEDDGVDYTRELLASGAAILRAQKQHVASMVKQARKCRILKPLQPTMFVPVADVNAPWVYDQDKSSGFVASVRGLAVNATLHMSEVGHELANSSGTFGLVYYIGSDNRVKCSLRSNGNYDVSAIARVFGGGGHRNAAGFETDINTLMGWLK